MKGTSIAVYGAAGYTGRRVAEELVGRGARVVLSGRDARVLEPVAAALGAAVDVRAARVDTPHELVAMLRGCDAVINCAGPFDATAEPLVRAALVSGCHYLDTTAEQRCMKRLFDGWDARAKDAGVAVVPGIGFFYVFGDLLAHLVGEGLADLDDVTLAYAVRGWRLTRGSRLTVLGFTKDRCVYERGAHRPASARLAASSFDFGGAIGRLRVFEYPAGEIVTVPRHLRTASVHAYLSRSAFHGPVLGTLALLASSALAPVLVSAAPLIDPLVAAVPDRTHAADRERSTFTILARATGRDGHRVGRVSGTDIYGISAVTAAEAAERVCAPGFCGRGAIAPAEAWGPRSFLDALAQRGVSYDVSEPGADAAGAA